MKKSNFVEERRQSPRIQPRPLLMFLFILSLLFNFATRSYSLGETSDSAPTPIPTSTPPAAPTAPACSSTFVAQPPDTLSIAVYGATGGDASDDTAAITSTISAARVQGKKVYIPAGTFYHKHLTLDGVSLTGEGREVATLYAFDPANNTIFLRGSGVTVSNIQIKSASIERTPLDWALYIDRATNFTIDNVIVDGGNSGGILNYGGAHGKIINNIVRNTLADAIHNTNGAHDTVVANNFVRHVGDDSVAVVGYEGDASAQPYNILIQGNDVGDSNWGRGIAVVGGKDVTIQDNKIVRTTYAAGILVASEPAYNTFGATNVLIRNNELIENSGATGHGAFLISGSHGNINFVRFEANTITNPFHDSIKLEGSNSNTLLLNNKMNDPEGKGINIVAGSNVVCTDNTLNGGAASNARCTGVNNFTVTGAPLTYVTTSPCP